MKRETAIKNSIQNYLKTLDNCVFERRDAIGFGYKQGMPDLWCLYEGMHYEIEVKDPSGETSNAQDVQRRRIEKAGGIYILAMSVDDVKDIIK